ncbi:MAG TPA: hypothetical protein ENN21_03025, partial [Spirochaetes bacterium]|nr:hypothetical protein [Spirochaetota bacterium]
YILEMMAERKKTAGELAAGMPRYWMRKGKVPAGATGPEKALEKIKKTFAGEKISDLDGLRVDFRKTGDFRDGWVHLRSSNTEPVFRVIAEGRTKKQADLIYRHFAAMFEKS